MPVSIQWADSDKTVIYTKLEGHAPAEELFATDILFREMLAEVDYLVDLIADYSRVVYFSPGFAETSQQLTAMEHENLRLVVFTGNRLAWELFEAYNREYGGISFQGAYAATVEDAYEIIDRVRAGEKVVIQPPAHNQWN